MKDCLLGKIKSMGNKRSSLESKKVIRIALFFGIVFLMASLAAAQGSISFSPSNPNVEQMVTFTLSPPCSFLGPVQWDFGDGSTLSGGTSVTHKYTAAGPFVVKATVNCDGTWTSTTTKIVVKENRRILHTPLNPKVKETVTFTAENFMSSSIKWDFGDGTVKAYGTKVETHFYSNPGTYLVKAMDFNGATCCPITTTMNVTAALKSSISFSPPSPKTGETVTFTAVNFTSPSCIRWDFGDGTAINDTSPPSITHTYTKAGTFSVKAFDACKSTLTASVTIQIAAVKIPSIAFSPQAPSVGESVTFTAHNFDSKTCVRWDFGDGTTVNDSSPPSVAHIYSRRGSFLVRAFDNCGASATASTTVRVGGDRRALSYTPSDPRVNEEITFQAKDFFTKRIRWDFGDGSVTPRGKTAERHTYRNPGSFTVKAWDESDQEIAQSMQQDLPPVSIQVTVSPDLRMISYSPVSPVTGQEITFTATNFRSPHIRWDLGDGTVKDNADPVVTHEYKREGRYTVKAFDFSGEDDYPKSTEVNITPSRGPAAPFNISFVQLRFDDGKDYKQVTKGFEPLVAYADLKYEGAGAFQAQWLVDGKPYQVVNESFPFADQRTIETGRTPPLPTRIEGMHEVSLSIVQPLAEYRIPVLRYYVSSGEAAAGISFTIANVEDLGGKIITVEEDRLVLAQGKDYFLKGTINNLSETEISSALLLVCLGDTLIDQQKISNLKPFEKRSFETSLLNDSSQQKKLSLKMADFSDREKILGARELSVVTVTVPVSPTPETEYYTPVISSLEPESLNAGSGADSSITINGSYFSPEATIRVRIAGVANSGNSIPPDDINCSQVFITIPEEMTATIKTLMVRVRNPDGQGGWLPSEWASLPVVASIRPTIPPNVPEITPVDTHIFNLSPDTYIRGGGAVDPLIIEGQKFILPNVNQQN
ncbi:MAG: PKD domain-containing protein, partial [Candidatus Aminicenantes bacterium]|nr:PKD domain-containing protein [Candidatus Aminicenantes bacterium]